MNRIKILSLTIIIFCNMLFLPNISSGVVQVGTGGRTENNSNANGITRITSFVKQIDSSTIVLEDNRRFSLTGVEVIDRRNGKRTEGKTVVDMQFINNVLKQVVIH